MPYEKILRFLQEPSPGDFEALALEAFAFQFLRIPAYRRLCERRGVRPGSTHSWRDVPAIPAAAFKSVELSAAAGGTVFRSSGTTSGTERRSVHRNPYPELYRAAIDHSFPEACLPAKAPVDMLSLIPSKEILKDSSLSFMVDHIFQRWGTPESAYTLGDRGLDGDLASRWVRAREPGKPVLVLSTALALLDWLDLLEARSETVDLPQGSLLFETGGFKGRRRETSRQELIPRIRKHLGIPRSQIVREYGMSELSSQFYTQIRSGGPEDVFASSPWVRARILDPATLTEATAGVPGILAIFDLANLGSAVHLLTEDLAVTAGDGFRLLGRATGSQLRGCSLTAEELAGGHSLLEGA